MERTAIRVVDTSKIPHFPDLGTRVFPSSAIINGAGRKHPTCAGHAGYAAFRIRKRDL
jgi:hypothetical protein